MPSAPSPFRQKLFRYVLTRARAVVVLVAVFAVVGWTGSWHWIPELFSHFFLQYALALILATVLLWRDGIWTLAALAVLGIIGYAIAPWSGESAPEWADAARLRILQFNAASQNAPMLEWLAQHGKEVDIVLVLEAGAKFRAEAQTLADEFPYHLEQLDDSPFSIALMSRHPFQNAETLEVIGLDFPALQADFVLEGRVVRLIGIHPPPPITAGLAELRNRFMTTLAERLTHERASGQETLVLGDFNSTVWSPHLRDFMAQTGLFDAQRGQGAPGTWPAAAARVSGLFGIPIDMTLVSNGVVVIERRIGPDWGSDHLPVYTEIALKTNESSGN